MNMKTYLAISGTLFALVAVLHLVRVLVGWDLVIDGWLVPMWASLLGVLVPGFLAVSAMRLVRSS